jgi:NAD+ dependent glucose-6-phosphate dehydrogenase
MSKTVVITGATGNLGVKLRRHFEGLGWTLRLTDVTNGGDPAVVEADLAVWDERWVTLFKDADAVILLAGNPHPGAPWGSIQRNNIDLPMNVYEAAARQNAKRVIFASSNWTMAGHRFGEGSVPTDREPYPVNAYGVSKLIGERMGRSYWDRWGLSVICFRIGWCQRGENKPEQLNGWGDWGQAMWLSDRDFCDGFEKAVTAPQAVGFQVLNLMSDNPGMRWDIETTKRVIGYAPRDGHVPKLTPEQQAGAKATQGARAMIEASDAWMNLTRY